MKEFMIETIKQAGLIAKGHANKHMDIKFKGLRDLVTEVDVEVEEFIKDKIKKKYPTHDFLGEESGRTQGESDFLWIVDPIDGTTNYARGLPLYCVSIALAKKNKVVEGAVYVPDLDELYYAKKGEGAFLNGKSIKVHDTRKFGEAVLELALYMKTPETQIEAKRVFNKLCGDCYKIRNFGPTAYAHCLVASGKVDAHIINKVNIWDMAAGKLLVEEAGGKETGFDGSEIGMEVKNVVASNGNIHEELIGLLKP